jgi:[ribosomal protein S18]-alanine N-acetyltransferase
MAAHPRSSSRTAPGEDVAPPFEVCELSIEDGENLAMWQTPGPWTVADSLEPPAADEGYWAIRDSSGQLVGYCCFGGAARVPGIEADAAMLDVVFGLRPNLVGHGLSNELARVVAAHAGKVAAGRRLRTILPQWNDAGRRAAEHAGFKVTGAHEVPGGARVNAYLVYSMTISTGA